MTRLCGVSAFCYVEGHAFGDPERMAMKDSAIGEQRAREAGFFRPRPLAAMLDGKGRPYFAWDTDWTLDEYLARLNGSDRALSDLLLARLMRQAAPADVFAFIRFEDVERRLPALVDNLGDRRAFWEWFVETVGAHRRAKVAAGG